MNSKEYDLFLNSLPYLFDNEPSKFLITHYMWESEQKLQQLIVHARLYDLIRRIYLIKLKYEPSKEIIISAIRKIQSKAVLKNYFKKFVINGHFPKHYQIKN